MYTDNTDRCASLWRHSLSTKTKCTMKRRSPAITFLNLVLALRCGVVSSFVLVAPSPTTGWRNVESLCATVHKANASDPPTTTGKNSNKKPEVLNRLSSNEKQEQLPATLLCILPLVYFVTRSMKPPTLYPTAE